MHTVEQSSDDKRIEPRKKIDYKATLYSIDHSSLECKIIDFSHHGILIEPDFNQVEPIALSMSSKVQLMIAVDTKSGKHNIILKGYIVRQCNKQFGIKLNDVDPLSLKVLEKLSEKKDFGVQLKSSKHLELAPSFVQVMDTSFRSMVADFIPEYVEECGDVLFNSARSARSNHLQQVYFEAKSLLESNRVRLTSRLQEEFSTDIKRIISLCDRKNKDESPSESKDFDMELLKDNDFDDWLMVRAAASKIESHHFQVLYELKMRLSKITLLQFDKKNMPLSPTILVEIMLDSLRHIEVPKDSERVLWDHFRDKLNASISKFYNQANQWLLNNGVLPDIFKAAKEESLVKEEPIDIDKLIAEVEKENPKEITERINAVDENDFKEEVEGNPYSLEDRAFKDEELKSYIKNNVPEATNTFWKMTQKWTKETLKNLGVRKSNEFEPEEIESCFDNEISDVETFKNLTTSINALTEKLKLQKALSELDKEMVYFVETFFSEVTNDGRLDEKVKPLINSLQIPAFKQLMKSDNMFADETHPLAEFVDKISSIGIKNSALFNKNYQKIKDSVNNIVNAQGDEQISVVKESCDELSKIIEEQTKVYQKNIKRVFDACEGKSQLNKTHRLVEEKILSILKGKRPPVVLGKLLNAGWKNLIVMAMNNESEKRNLSVYWQVVEGLSSFELSSASGFKKNVFLDIIKDGLMKIQGGTLQTPEIIAELELLFDESVDLNEEEIFNDEWFNSELHENVHENNTHENNEKKNRQPPKDLGNWNKIVDGLRIGDYIEVRVNENDVLAKLAWMDNSTNMLVFVNHQGLKVIEYSADALSEAMYFGEVKINYEAKKPLIENVMERFSRVIGAQ